MNIVDEGTSCLKSVIDEDQCEKLRKYIKSLIKKNPKSEKNIILHSKCIKDKKIYKFYLIIKLMKI